MKGLVLAAGYATRLRPLTEHTAKPLLPLAGRPMLDYLVEAIQAAGVGEVHVVTNSRFARDFERWAGGRNGVFVHDDGTWTNEDRLGAVGDIQFTVERAELEDDLLIVAGDNLFEFDLREIVDFWRAKDDGSAIAVREVDDRQLLRQYSVLDVDAGERVTSFVEKPDEPQGTLAGVAIYVLHREHVPLVRRYLEEGNVPDQPGRFFAWLSTRAPLYAYRFTGDWLDIGDREQLLEADNRMRKRAGLPARAEYALS
ncbi:MAG: nucleotidyltransferase family protein [Thermoleophilia bacterium]|nr:nucleotidyltransferase family protein [Thermoleophilia bacterium]